MIILKNCKERLPLLQHSGKRVITVCAYPGPRHGSYCCDTIQFVLQKQHQIFCYYIKYTSFFVHTSPHGLVKEKICLLRDTHGFQPSTRTALHSLLWMHFGLFRATADERSAVL